MSEPKLISPMLDGFAVGGPISDHHGVRCYPAMQESTGDKYIIKIISVPASRSQLEALLLSGACADEASAQNYFKQQAEELLEEVKVLQRLSDLDGFVRYEQYQCQAQENGTGFDIYLLGTYRRSLDRYLQKHQLTQLGALNLGLDLCSALMAARRSGYLYADLRPANIYMVDDNAYRIGDLGFISLDALRYTSLPDKYRSAYTAPEIADAFSDLNTTIDVYAVGLILYQVYNGGVLPFSGQQAPAETFPAPEYADYEMSEIILKACAPDPSDRWTDPMQMGQALVGYMQRNGASDTPIIPPPVTPEETAEEAPSDIQKAEDEDLTEQTTDTNIPEIAQANQEESTDESLSSEATEEDELGNLDAILTDNGDETDPSLNADDIAYEEISEDLSDMLSQVDEIANHPVPDPVVAPEAIEVPMPEPIVIEPEAASVPENEPEDAEQSTQDEAQIPAESQPDEDLPTAEAPEEVYGYAEPPKKRHWLRNSIVVLFLLALIGAGVYFYSNYYLVPIEAIVLNGTEDELTVQVTSKIDESLLTVICSDPHGNQIRMPVKDGLASFTNLAPDTAYTVTVEVNGFHKLTGDTSKAYSTPIQTNIVQFSAITGSEAGSAILSFTLDGPDSDQWKLLYSAPGEALQSISFPAHTATVTGLTVGKEYTFTLVPETELYLTGTNEVKHTASALLYAEKLMITSCSNGQLTAQWQTPENMEVSSWSVRCYNNEGFNETIITSDNNATFENIVDGNEYTVEVAAAGMSVSQRAFVTKTSVTVSNITVSVSGSTATITWDSDKDVGENGWTLSYTVNGVALTESVSSSENKLVIDNYIPGATYELHIMQQDGTYALGGNYIFISDEAETFSSNFTGNALTADNLTLTMCRTPDEEDWNRYYLDDSDYTTQFRVNEGISFVVRVNKSYGYSDVPMAAMFVVEDSEGVLVCASSYSRTWDDMWYRSYCELDVPTVPSQPGEYTMSVYFDGQFVTQQAFRIIP